VLVTTYVTQIRDTSDLVLLSISIIISDRTALLGLTQVLIWEFYD
jgi:hypothetical protein